MRIDYTGRQMEITPDLRQYKEERLRKLVRLLGEGFGLHVILTAEKHRRIAELALAIRDHTLVGIEETGDARTAIKGALDKLERQAVRLLERRRTRKRPAQPAAPLRLNGPPQAGRPRHPKHRGLAAEGNPPQPLTN